MEDRNPNIPIDAEKILHEMQFDLSVDPTDFDPVVESLGLDTENFYRYADSRGPEAAIGFLSGVIAQKLLEDQDPLAEMRTS